MSRARFFSASNENGAGAPIFKPCCAKVGLENPLAAKLAVAVANCRNWRRSNMGRCIRGVETRPLPTKGAGLSPSYPLENSASAAKVGSHTGARDKRRIQGVRHASEIQ